MTHDISRHAVVVCPAARDHSRGRGAQSCTSSCSSDKRPNSSALQECNITRKYAYTVLITGALKHDTVLHIRVLCISSAATQYFNAVPHLMSYDCGEYVNFSSSFFDCAAAAAALPGE